MRTCPSSADGVHRPSTALPGRCWACGLAMAGDSLARSTDPATSHDAAEHVTRSGVAAGQRAKCLWYLREHPGAIAAEVSVGTGLGRDATDIHRVSRRLSDLANAGTIYPGASRKAPSGRQQQTWWVR